MTDQPTTFLGEDVDLGLADVHTVAGLMKLYLRELPEPLLTFRLYDPLITVVRRGREWDEIKCAMEAKQHDFSTS